MIKSPKITFLALLFVLLLYPIQLVGVQAAVAMQQQSTPTPSPDERIRILETELAEIDEKIENPPKDNWDKINSMSGLISGGVVALLGIFVTLIVSRRQNQAESEHKRREMKVLELQTLQSFMPHLQSENQKVVETALLSISALLDDSESDLVTKLATLYHSDGAISALSRIARSPSLASSTKAQQSLDSLYHSASEAIVVILLEDVPGSYGTGFFINPSGYLITMGYVVHDNPMGSSVLVVFNGKKYPGTIVHFSDKDSIAVVKINAEAPVPFLILAEQDTVAVDDSLFVIGNKSMGHNQFGLNILVGTSDGILRVRKVGLGEGYYIKFQEAYSSNGYMSGGYAGAPVMNQGREVVGIFAMADMTLGIAYLLSSGTLRGLVQQYIKLDSKTTI